jgi:hypothetical protein
MGATVLQVSQGTPPPLATGVRPPVERPATVLPIFLFLALALLPGLYLPHELQALLADAASYLEVAR